MRRTLEEIFSNPFALDLFRLEKGKELWSD